MSEIKILSLSPLSFKMLIYGAFSVVCHLSAVTLYFFWYADSIPHALLVRTSASMLEHSLMSTVAILVGALLLEMLCRESDNEAQE